LDSHTDDGDTLTAHDFVTRQYENFPYPEVTEEELLYEEYYYKSLAGILFNIYAAHLLEKSNHFFHRGKQNFQ
jgi:hypothetical protein